jgi:hypothetical protein
MNKNKKRGFAIAGLFLIKYRSLSNPEFGETDCLEKFGKSHLEEFFSSFLVRKPDQQKNLII